MSVKIVRTYTCDRCEVEADFLSHGWLRLSPISMWSRQPGETFEYDYCPKCAKLAWAALKPEPAGVS